MKASDLGFPVHKVRPQIPDPYIVDAGPVIEFPKQVASTMLSRMVLFGSILTISTVIVTDIVYLTLLQSSC